jgi:hypothetical protein
MSRILIATSPEKGHLNPMIGVAQWLRHLSFGCGRLVRSRGEQRLRQDHQAQQQDECDDDGDDDTETRHLLR